MEYRKIEIRDDRETKDVNESVDKQGEAEPLSKMRLAHLVKLTALLLVTYLAFTGTLSQITGVIGGRHVESVDRSYIKVASQSATDLLEVLSASKIALALLTSSKGGIDFFINIEVQLGQSLSVFYDMVNYAWIFTLASLAATKGLELLLDLSHVSMAPVLTLFFCCMGLSLGVRSRLPSISAGMSVAARHLLFAALLVHFVVPLSIYGVAAAGHHFFEDHKKTVHDGFSSLQAILPQHDLQAGLHSEVEVNIKHLQNNKEALHKSTSTLSNLTARHIVLVIGEYFFVPLVFLYALVSLSLRLNKWLWRVLGAPSKVLSQIIPR